MSKAGRPKKDSARLPAWFDIEQYRQVKSFGAAEWHQQLAFRDALDYFYSYKGHHPWCIECQDLIHKDPIVTIERIKQAYPILPESLSYGHDVRHFMADRLIEEMTLEAHSAEGIRPMTRMEVLKAFITLQSNAKAEEKGRRRKGLKPYDKMSSVEWENEMQLPFDGDRYGKYENMIYTRTDFSLPDAILLKNYADYLKTHRKYPETSKSPFFKNQDFKVWYNSGVLPYLDLIAWEMMSGKSFLWAAFVDALNTITDHPVGSEEACRKTAKALANKLIDSRTLRMLSFQAIKEQSGRYKKCGKLFVR